MMASQKNRMVHSHQHKRLEVFSLFPPSSSLYLCLFVCFLVLSLSLFFFSLSLLSNCTILIFIFSPLHHFSTPTGILCCCCCLPPAPSTQHQPIIHNINNHASCYCAPAWCPHTRHTL